MRALLFLCISSALLLSSVAAFEIGGFLFFAPPRTKEAYTRKTKGAKERGVFSTLLLSPSLSRPLVCAPAWSHRRLSRHLVPLVSTGISMPAPCCRRGSSKAPCDGTVGVNKGAGHAFRFSFYARCAFLARHPPSGCRANCFPCACHGLCFWCGVLFPTP